MKKIFLFATFCLATIMCSAQVASPVYTHEYYDKKLIKEAKAWLKKGEWRQGFTAASPNKSVNIVEFYLQYKKNPEQWTKLFQYLAKTDLLALPKGKQPIPDSDLAISVEDSENGPLEKRQSESHYHVIDFQYCVKGVERFGIIDHVTSTPNCKYKPDVIHYDYKKERAKFYDSKPSEFFIMFPGDWHIAKINNDTKDQNIRVCVVKVKYVE